MLFEITSTSGALPEDLEHITVDLPVIDTKRFTVEEFNSLFPNPWHSKGKDHTTYTFSDGRVGIQRTLMVPMKRVEIESIEALHAFVKKYGTVVVHKKYYEGRLPTIEIYDEDRE